MYNMTLKLDTIYYNISSPPIQMPKKFANKHTHALDWTTSFVRVCTNHTYQNQINFFLIYVSILHFHYSSFDFNYSMIACASFLVIYLICQKYNYINIMIVSIQMHNIN